MSTCPCCSDKLLAHIYRGKRIWFCAHCRQEMPNFDLYRMIKNARPVKTFVGIAK